MLTASNVFRISRLKDSTNPDNLISNLMGKSSISDSDHLLPPLEWGRKKEIPAGKLSLKLHKVEMLFSKNVA